MKQAFYKISLGRRFSKIRFQISLDSDPLSAYRKDGQFSRQRCLDPGSGFFLDTDPALKNKCTRIRFVLRAWILTPLVLIDPDPDLDQTGSEARVHTNLLVNKEVDVKTHHTFLKKNIPILFTAHL